MEYYAKLRWQCRRGCKELDLLLLRYLENSYADADETEKQRFAELLQMDDCKLLELLVNSPQSKNPVVSLMEYGRYQR